MAQAEMVEVDSHMVVTNYVCSKTVQLQSSI